MPISAENRARYPADWKAISLRIRKERARDRCEWPQCGAENARPHPVTGSKVVLTVAHLNHTPEDCRDENLMAMCQRCHLRYDAPEKARRRREKASVGQSSSGAGTDS